MGEAERRIQALSLRNGGSEHILAVGMNGPDDDEPVLLILESSDMNIFVACPEGSRRACTPSNGIEEGVPFPLGLSPSGRAYEFDPVKPRLH